MKNVNSERFNSLFMNDFMNLRRGEDVQLGQGYPSGLQNRAFQVTLEDQQDQSFLGDLPIRTLPFTKTQKQKQDAQRSVKCCLFVCYFCKTEGHQGNSKSAFVGFSTLAPFSPCLPSGPAGPMGPCLKQEKMTEINLVE